MYIDFVKDGKNFRLKTPRKTVFSEVKIRNTKKAIVVSVKKTNRRVLRVDKLKKIGQLLLEDRIPLQEFHVLKSSLFENNKKRIIIKLKKDENSLVVIQKDLF